jgi:delta-lactam-biosynthetic de-N-acetylase
VDAELACVVLSLRDEPGLAAAVRSLLSQSVPIEIVVVNSGGGMPADTLRRARLDVPVIDRAERLNPGAVRNIGIAATRAPYVSFLAADCLAGPEWAAGRIRAHRSGALAVASAVTNAYPHNAYAWASYILLFPRRAPGPGVPPGARIFYGLSYARELFTRFGRFREDLRTGEDTEFNRRLNAVVPIAWAPDVRTAHRHPTGLAALIRDQFVRGKRGVQALDQLGPRPSRRQLARRTLGDIPAYVLYTWRSVSWPQRIHVIGGCVFVVPAALATVAGLFLSRASVAPSRLPTGGADPGGGAAGAQTQRIDWWIHRVPNAPPSIDGRLQDLLARYNGFYIGDPLRNRIALTFDVGDQNDDAVPALLDTLRRHNARGSFFLTGKWIASNAPTVDRIVKEAHLIGNHSYSHLDLTTLTPEQVANEIAMTTELIKKSGNGNPRFFRPPFGYFSEAILSIVSGMGYITAFWSISMVDWEPMEQQRLIHGVIDYLHNGAVVLLHVTSDGVNALDTTISQIRSRGYQLVRIDQLAGPSNV